MSKAFISENITYSEGTRHELSNHYNNDPWPEQLENMKRVANEVFEKIRKSAGVPILITSFYRSHQIELAKGRAGNSQHCKGEAMDLKSTHPIYSNAWIFNYIRKNLTFDQAIWEKGDDKNPAWVHVSLKKEGNRMQCLKTKDGINYEII
jgi:hypothetical protein